MTFVININKKKNDSLRIFSKVLFLPQNAEKGVREELPVVSRRKS